MQTAPRYSFTVAWSEEDKGYVASCPELEGITGWGETSIEAVSELSEALRLAVQTYEEEGWELPPENHYREYSGQFRLRLPKSLHRWLAHTAEQEGVSLNTFVVARLSRKLLCR